MDGKVVLITGANAGIGFATAVAIAKLKPKLYIACRSEEKAKKALDDIKKRSGNDNVHFIRLDLNDLDSVDECAKEFQQKESRLDVLINNAGIMAARLSDRSKQGFERTFAVNFLGHFLFTMHLIPLLKASVPSRIINLASLTHSKGRIDFNTLEYWKLLMDEGRNDIHGCPLFTLSSNNPTLENLYANTKLAKILFSNELAARLEGTGIVSNSLCPGIVATSILEDFGFIIRVFGPIVMRIMAMVGIGVTADTAAKTPLMLASSPKYEKVSGKYFTHQNEKETAIVGKDKVSAMRLWNIAESLTKCRERVPNYSKVESIFVKTKIPLEEQNPGYTITDTSVTVIIITLVVLLVLCIGYILFF